MKKVLVSLLTICFCAVIAMGTIGCGGDKDKDKKKDTATKDTATKDAKDKDKKDAKTN